MILNIWGPKLQFPMAEISVLWWTDTCTEICEFIMVISVALMLANFQVKNFLPVQLLVIWGWWLTLCNILLFSSFSSQGPSYLRGLAGLGGLRDSSHCWWLLFGFVNICGQAVLISSSSPPRQVTSLFRGLQTFLHLHWSICMPIFYLPAYTSMSLPR